MKHKNKSVISWISADPTPGFKSLEDEGPATSRGGFLGEDNSDLSAEGELIFTDPNNLPTAIATILNHAQKKADFHPIIQSPNELSSTLEKYIFELSKIPFYNNELHNSVSKDYNSKDYNVLINQVVAMYKDFPESYLEDLKIMISNMGKSVFGNVKGQGYINIFAALTVSVIDETNPIILIYEGAFNMYHDDSGKDEVSKQSYTIKRNIYYISHEKIKDNAKQLTELLTTSISDWEKNVTSPEQKDKKLCFVIRKFRDKDLNKI
jgi:hypothetical protein